MQMTTHITQLPSSIGCLMKNSTWTQWSGSRLGRVHRTLQTYYRSISRNIGPYSLPKNLPKSHPLTYIPINGTTLVAIWQLGSPSCPSKPEKHHRHQRQLDLPPSFFFWCFSHCQWACACHPTPAQYKSRHPRPAPHSIQKKHDTVCPSQRQCVRRAPVQHRKDCTLLGRGSSRYATLGRLSCGRCAVHLKLKGVLTRNFKAELTMQQASLLCADVFQELLTVTFK